MVSTNVPQKFIDRCNDLTELLKYMWLQRMYTFDELVPRRLESIGAVYVIGDVNTDDILYVGRTKDLKRRMYTNHLMGNQSTARLKKYLTKDELLEEFARSVGVEFPNVEDPDQYQDAYRLAKRFIREKCYFKFITVDESRMRGLFEAGLTYALDTKFIEEEH